MTGATRATDVLAGTSVVELASGIAGGFCTRVLADAGATVTKVEDPSGDPLRRRRSSSDAVTPGGVDGALSRYLFQSHRRVTVDADDDRSSRTLAELLAAADVVVWSSGSAVAARPDCAPQRIAEAFPNKVVCSITPFGRSSAWAGRPATDLTLQAWSGALAQRGGFTGPPVAIGGDMAQWATGVFAVTGVLTALHRARTEGRGALIDVSELECLATGAAPSPVTFLELSGRPLREGRMMTLPGLYQARDGWVGFMVITGRQWQDFCVVAGHPEWIDDERLLMIEHRIERHAELTAAIEEHLATLTVAEVLDLADALRVPAAPLGNGRVTPELDHPRETAMFERSADGTFLRPAPWYRISGNPEHRSERRDVGAATTTGRTAEGSFGALRILDMTAFWAGPLPGRLLAMLGSDVIRVESHARPDGFRMSIRPDDDPLGEWSPMTAAINVGKRNLGLDLSTERGREVLLDLVERSDVVVENYAPRVWDDWCLGPEQMWERNPSLVVLRMPAYGLEGPWRNRPGYAQTTEMASGMAWRTGFPDGSPLLPNGIVDALGGHLALSALLLGLERRRRTGTGCMVESALFAAALALTSESVVEYSANGVLLERIGNRDPEIAPQGVYRCADDDSPAGRWVAISAQSDAAWASLREVLGRPAWAEAPELDRAVGRRAHHDLIDAHLASWCATRTSHEIVSTLWRAGVAVGTALMPHEQLRAAPLTDPAFHQVVDHPLMGPARYQTTPIRFAEPGVATIRRPTALLGEHDEAILREVLGLDDIGIAELSRCGVIGSGPTRPALERGQPTEGSQMP